MDSGVLERAKGLLAQLVAFDTVSDKSNLPLIAFVEAYLQDLGVATRRVPNARGDKAALLATIGPEVDGGVVLSGHTDVVPVTGQAWSGDPFKLREIEGRLYGRGACDMKGFDAAVLAMAPHFQAADLQRPIHILLSYDEETSCLGSIDVISRFGVDLPRPGMVIVGEPTLMQVADAHKGVATFVTRVTGVDAHSANARLGANAISAACEIVAEIDRLGRECEAPEFIHGGTARNILASECVFEWEFRGLPNMTSMEALARVQSFIDTVALPRLRRHTQAPRIETVMDVDVPGLRTDNESIAAAHGLVLALKNRTIAVSYATEAGHFQRAGLPTIVCGPGSIDQAHKPDEFIEISQLTDCFAFLERMARSLKRLS